MAATLQPGVKRSWRPDREPAGGFVIQQTGRSCETLLTNLYFGIESPKPVIVAKETFKAGRMQALRDVTNRFSAGIFLVTVLFAVSLSAQSQGPAITGLDPGSDLQWSGGQTNRAAAIEVTTNLSGGAWNVLKFDYSTNGVRQVSLPSNAPPGAFYRVKIINEPEDPSLVLHLTFENDMGVVNGVTNWVMVDSSGYNNHGFSYPLAGTNVHRWPSPIEGPDGGQAGDFRMYYDGYAKYGRSGDWVCIPLAPSLAVLSNATIMAWARYYREDYFPDSPRYELVQNATIFNAYYQGAPWSWNLGRTYSPNTVFTVLTANLGDVDVIRFPDYASTTGGDSGGWHHYVVTFNEGVFHGYYDGTNLLQTQGIGTNVLIASRYYAALGCWNFGRAPASGTYTAGYPNAGWMYGSIDDVRIYNRVLSAEEVGDIYNSFDKQPPTAPADLHATTISPGEVAFAWSPSTDRFGVAGYRLRRDGLVVADVVDVVETNCADSSVVSGSSYDYTVEAYDQNGNTSAQSSLLSVAVP